MGKLAEAYVEISARQDPFERGLSSVRGKLVSTMSEFRRLATIPLAITGGVGAAGATAFLVSATNAAANLNETLSKVSVVFGHQATRVGEFADDMAEKFGLVRREVLDATAAFGLILQGAGMTQQQSAGLSITLAKLAADASSFYNVPIADALEKIRAGLSGEAEPLRAFGVLLSENAVKAKAAAMGFGELTEAAKAAARAQLIVEGLAKASGDLERTSDSLSNQQRKLAGDWENLKTSIGTGLVPAMQELIDTVYLLGDALDSSLGGDRAASIEQLTASIGGFASGMSQVVNSMATGAGGGTGGYLLESLERLGSTSLGVGQWLTSFGGAGPNMLSGLLGEQAGVLQRDADSRNFARAREIALAKQRAGGKPLKPAAPAPPQAAMAGAAGGGDGVGHGLMLPFGIAAEADFAESWMFMRDTERLHALKNTRKDLRSSRDRVGDLEQTRRDRLAQGGVMGDQYGAVRSLQSEILNDLPRQQLEEAKKQTAKLEAIEQALVDNPALTAPELATVLSGPA